MTTQQKKTKNIEEIYQKKDLHEHIISRPDSYIGSIKNSKEEMWVADDNNKIIKKTINYNPGLLKIFDEILVNAIDHSVQDKNVTKINIKIKDGIITIQNNGEGIPVVLHGEYGIYIPELIFGNLLTGTNYDDSEERTVGGRNGLGSKLANIFSKKFKIETVDSTRKLKYVQQFSKNMYEKTSPVITKTDEAPYTKIVFFPDYSLFGMKNLSDDMFSVMKRRAYDTTATTDPRVSVFFNGVKLKEKDFQSYAKLYPIKNLIYDNFKDGKFIWEYAVSFTDTSASQVSFVNGINTTQGGKHVDYILNQIIKKISETLESKKKIGGNLKPSYIKDRLFIFVRSTVVNPSFNNQSKEMLTTPIKDFGVKIEINESFVNKIYKSGLVEDLLSFVQYKNQKLIEKGDGKKKNKITGIPKLEDALLAGTSKSDSCSLILTEGDSAMTFAVSGFSVIGRERYGAFALRGKALNVREATQNQLMTNVEIANIKKILGLQHQKKYTDTSSLRYGSIIILTDADLDGSHITGLIINLFHTWWPELLEIKGFIKRMKTPIIKATNKSNSKEFYTVQDYREWEKSLSNAKTWNIKYYKGLGTSTAKEAKDLFKRLDQNLIKYKSNDVSTTEKSILLAFEKKQADNRKDWLSQYSASEIPDQAATDISYSDFINKELIHFSIYDVARSIPNICDGMKPSQRKILYTLFNKNYTKEIKVAQLGAAVAEFSGYHHGETSLYGAIINLAQDYVGSNNINLLKPNGQFGTRLMNGSDAASPRYIYTELSDVTKQLFLKDDTPLLKEQYDDGYKIEPLFYVPILPIVLINGASGIGTGFSTSIPPFNPDDIIKNIKNIINGDSLIEMVPWYKNFKGEIKKVDEGYYSIRGIYKALNTKSIQITELPIGVWTNNFKEILENISEIQEYKITNILNNSTETDVDFVVNFSSKEDRDAFLKRDDIDKILKMVKSLSTRNMHLFDNKGFIKKYSNVEEILKDFVDVRLEYNSLRKKNLLKNFKKDNEILQNKVRFLTEIIAGEFEIYKRKKQDIIKDLETKKYYKCKDSNYDYLISLPIYSFTIEKISEYNEKIQKIQKSIIELENKTSKDILIDDIEKITK